MKRKWKKELIILKNQTYPKYTQLKPLFYPLFEINFKIIEEWEYQLCFDFTNMNFETFYNYYKMEQYNQEIKEQFGNDYEKDLSGAY
jgi:hypothetical protein